MAARAARVAWAVQAVQAVQAAVHVAAERQAAAGLAAGLPLGRRPTPPVPLMAAAEQTQTRAP